MKHIVAKMVTDTKTAAKMRYRNLLAASGKTLENDGLHARMFFANDDPLADHAYAIADGISYSIGFDEFADGYEGADSKIDGAVGILREISMVVTGNDPRAKTSDQKAEVRGSQTFPAFKLRKIAPAFNVLANMAFCRCHAAGGVFL